MRWRREPRKIYATFFFSEAHQSWAVGPLGRWAVGPLGRWAVGPLGRWAVGPLTGIALVSACGVSQAQSQWNVTTTSIPTNVQGPPALNPIGNGAITGTINTKVNNQWMTSSLDRNWGIGPTGNYFAYIPYVQGNAGKSGDFVQSAGTWKYKFYIQPSNSNPGDELPPLPDSIPMMWNLDAGAYVPDAGADLADVEATVSAGDGTSTTATSPGNWFLFRKQLFQLPTKNATVQNGIYVVEAESPVLSAKITAGGGTGQIGYSIHAYVNATAQQDYRSVTLSRAGAREERQDLQNGEWHGYSDSIYSAHSPVIYPNDDLFYPLSIGVNYAGNWSRWGTGYNVSPSWTTSGFEPVDGTNNSSAWGKTKFGTPIRSVTNFHGIPYYNGLEGEPTGAETFDTTYTAVDNGDGATAKSYYHLTLHDPVEKDGADDISTYHVTFPMSNGSDIAYIGENSATESERPLVEVGHSTQYGYGITATVGIEGVASLLGLSAEASAQAESTTTITATTTKRVPHLTEGQKVYLVADHPFQRTHVRFWKYDEGGKVKRMLRISDEGVTPPAEIEVHHEAFQDTAAQATYDWSPIYEESQLDIGNLPHTPAPELPYDYSGGSS